MSISLLLSVLLFCLVLLLSRVVSSDYFIVGSSSSFLSFPKRGFRCFFLSPKVVPVYEDFPVPPTSTSSLVTSRQSFGTHWTQVFYSNLRECSPLLTDDGSLTTFILFVFTPTRSLVSSLVLMFDEESREVYTFYFHLLSLYRVPFVPDHLSQKSSPFWTYKPPVSFNLLSL